MSTVADRPSRASSAVGLLADPSAWSGALFDGQWRGASRQFVVTNPATGLPLASVGEASPAEVQLIVRAAFLAQREWGSRPANERAQVLRRAASILEDHCDEVATWIMRETGGIEPKARFETATAIEEIHHAVALLIEPEGHVLASPDPDRFSIARRVPLGVVGVITPWNFPLLLGMRSVAPALAFGNAVILKPDPHTPVVGGILLCRLFEAAGLPAGVLGLIPGGAETGEALVTAPEVRMITFTGSTAVGRRVGELAGRNLKKVALELGGNNPMLVLDDCDLSAAVSAGAFGSFCHQGQVCMATGRHIVHRRIADAYIESLASTAAHLPVGDPTKPGTALGPLIDVRQVDRVHRIVTTSVSQGARLRAGGTHDGLFYRATVLADVVPGMPAFDEEIFGPVAPVTVAEDDEQAVMLANSTQYGLAAAVQTGSLERGLRIARQLRAGMVHINDQTVNDLPQCPMGGMGQSGNGSRFGSISNRDEFTEWQWLTASATPKRYPY